MSLSSPAAMVWRQRPQLHGIRKRLDLTGFIIIYSYKTAVDNTQRCTVEREIKAKQKQKSAKIMHEPVFVFEQPPN